MDQLQLLQKSYALNQQFTKLMLEGGELPDLVQELALLLKRSVCIEDPAYYIIADTQMGEVDAARFQSVQYGRASRNLTQGLIDGGIYERIELERAPFFVEPLPDIGMTNGRIIAPIIIDQTIHGIMWVISDAPLSQLDQLIIEQGITAAALIMLKDKAAREARYALSGDFFANLLQGQDDDQFLRQAERLDYKLEQPRQILLINGVPTDGGSQQSVSKAMELWQEESGNMGLKAWHNDQLVLMLANGETSYGVDVSKALLEILHHPEWQLSIGVGQAYQDATPNRVRQSFLEAREALKVGERLGDKNTAVYPFHTLGIHHWLNHLSPQQIDNNHYMDHIATIVDYDSRHQAELLKTLETFLDNRLSMARTAVDLHIHRNTLNKRLYRIEHLTGVNLENAHALYNFYAALIVQKLN